jgi:hypothetical protein
MNNFAKAADELIRRSKQLPASGPLPALLHENMIEALPALNEELHRLQARARMYGLVNYALLAEWPSLVTGKAVQVWLCPLDAVVDPAIAQAAEDILAAYRHAGWRIALGEYDEQGDPRWAFTLPFPDPPVTEPNVPLDAA